MRNSHCVDVAIVGASLAGSCAAAKLAAVGVSVALVDRARFPRTKACGEGLSGSAYSSLKGAGFASELLAVPTHPFSGFSFPSADGPPLVISMAPNCGVEVDQAEPAADLCAGFGVERLVLDESLQHALRRYDQVEFFLESRVDSIEQRVDCLRGGMGSDSKKFWRILLRSVGKEGRISRNCELFARHLIVADGARSMTSSQLKIPGLKPRHGDQRWGVTARLQGSFAQPATHVSLMNHEGLELYCTPLAGERLNISMLGGKGFPAVTRDRASLERLLAPILLKIGFKGELVAEPSVAGPVGAQRRPSTHSGVFIVGDACEQFDPVGGMGMTHAIKSGLIAGQLLGAALNEEYSVEQALSRYRHLQSIEAIRLRGFTRLVGLGIRSPLKHLLNVPMLRVPIESMVLPSVHLPSLRVSLTKNAEIGADGAEPRGGDRLKIKIGRGLCNIAGRWL